MMPIGNVYMNTIGYGIKYIPVNIYQLYKYIYEGLTSFLPEMIVFIMKWDPGVEPRIIRDK